MNVRTSGPGRHAAGNVSRFDGPTLAVLAIAVVVLVLGALGLRALFSDGSAEAASGDGDGDGAGSTSETAPAASCDSTIELNVAAAPEVAGAVEQAASAAGIDPCTTVRVVSLGPASVAAAIESGDAPDVWIPDAADWTSRITEHRAGEGRFTLTSLVAPAEPPADQTAAGWVDLGSVARTPVVLAVPQGREGEVPDGTTWRSALISLEGLRLAQPSTSSASRLAFITGRGIDEAQGDDYLLLGQRVIFLSRFAATREAELFIPVDDTVPPFPVSEQHLARDQAGSPEIQLVPRVLAGPAPELTYPMYARADLREPLRQAAEQLLTATSSDEVVATLAAEGFRTPTGSGPTINDVAPAEYEAGELPGAERMLDATHLWETLRLDMRMIAAIDVSGSMLWAAGDTTRLDLLQRAVLNALGVLPDGSQIGSWVFSTNIGADGEDWLPRIPMRQLSADVNGTSQRDLLRAEVAALDEQITGDTGLYDTALAAFREVQKGYDPGYINSVVLITDGINDDPGGGLSLEQLLTELEAAADPERPVRIVTIGIGPDTDPTSLQAISDAMFGTTYVATEPEDIEMVFFRALLARAA